VSSCVTRLAGYLVAEDLLPDQVSLLPVPGLVCGRPEDVAMLERYPTIVVDGCADQCGSNLLRLAGVMPAARIYTPDVVHETRLQPGFTRRELEDSGCALAEEIATRVARLATAMLGGAGYEHRPQRVAPDGPLCDRDTDVAEALGYVKVAEGLYRPRAMPELPGEQSAAT
jgi:hypothetical protein